MMDNKTTAVVKFRAKLGIDQHDTILTKENSIGSKIMKVFSDEKIIGQYFVWNERIDLYIPKHKLAIEVDELGHLARDEEGETKRQEKLSGTNQR